MKSTISIIFLIISPILCEPDPTDTRKSRGGISSSSQNAIPGPINEFQLNGKAGESLPQLPQGLEQYDIGGRVAHSQIYSHISSGSPPPIGHQPQGVIYNVQSQQAASQTPLMIQYAPVPLQQGHQGAGQQQLQLIQLIPTPRAIPHMILQLHHGNSVLLGHGGNSGGLYANQVPQILGLGIGYQPQGRIQLVVSPHSPSSLNTGLHQEQQGLNTNEFIPSQPSVIKQ